MMENRQTVEVWKGLPNDKINKLIAEVRQRPFLWDRNSQDYKDNVIKEEAWNEIAEQLEIPATRTKKVWCNLRDTRTRYMKRDKMVLASGKPLTRSKLETWKWAVGLDFLSANDRDIDFNSSDFNNSCPSINEGTSSDTYSDDGTVGLAEDYIVMATGSSPNSQIPDQSQTAVGDLHGTLSSRQVSLGVKRKRPGLLNEEHELKKMYLSYIRENDYTTLDEDREADKLWLLSLLPNFKDMSLQKKNRIKYRIQGIFIEEEDAIPT